MAGAEGARCALAVHVQATRLAVDRVRLELAGVVGDVIDQGQVGSWQHVREHLAGQVGDDLTVGQGTVDRGAHRAEVGLPQRGFDGCAGKFAVGQLDAIPWRSDHHLPEEFGTDLVAQSTRSTVNADHHFAHAQAEAVGRLRVIDFDDFLQFEVMVAGPEGADLVTLAALGLVGNFVRLGAGHAAVFLDALDVGIAAVAVFDRPARAAAQHRVHFAGVEAQQAGAAQAGRDVGEQAVGKPLLERSDVRGLQPGVQGAHAAGNVESHPASRHHAALVGIERRHPADRETVAPVCVGHGVGRLNDARQGGDVGELFVDLVVHLADQSLIGIDHRRNAHFSERGDAPLDLRHLLELGWVHFTRPPRTGPAIARILSCLR